MSVTCSIGTEVECLVGGINGAERLNYLFGCTWEVCVRVQSTVVWILYLFQVTDDSIINLPA